MWDRIAQTIVEAQQPQTTPNNTTYFQLDTAHQHNQHPPTHQGEGQPTVYPKQQIEERWADNKHYSEADHVEGAEIDMFDDAVWPDNDSDYDEAQLARDLDDNEALMGNKTRERGRWNGGAPTHSPLLNGPDTRPMPKHTHHS